VVPVNPYIKEQPNSRKPDEKAPKTKYLRPASAENSEFLLKELKIYEQKLCNSIARYIDIKS
jgi:hypothetical protein